MFKNQGKSEIDAHCSLWPINKLAKVGLNGEPIATP